MNLLRIMPAALLMSLSLGVYAQDDDLEAALEDEDTEVTLPSTPTDKMTFQRVQLGFVGTNVKTTDNVAYADLGGSPDFNNYFLKGISFGWAGDLRIDKAHDLFFEIGANFAYQTGGAKDEQWNVHHDEYYKYKVNAFSIAIPVSVNKQFKDAFGVEKLTVAPFVGAYARFNVMAKRKAKAYSEDGTYTGKSYTASLMDTDDGPQDFGESSRYMRAITESPHVGKLLQVGVQVGANAYYKHYYFGLAYMYDLTPFAKHNSPLGLTTEERSVGGVTVSSGTGCDMKITTRHNFAINVGYVF